MRVNQAFIESTGYTAMEVFGQKMNLLKSGRRAYRKNVVPDESAIYISNGSQSLLGCRLFGILTFSGLGSIAMKKQANPVEFKQTTEMFHSDFER